MTPVTGGPQGHRDQARSALIDAASAAATANLQIARAMGAIARGREPLDEIVEAHAQLDRSVEALHRAKRFALHGFPLRG